MQWEMRTLCACPAAGTSRRITYKGPKRNTQHEDDRDGPLAPRIVAILVLLHEGAQAGPALKGLHAQTPQRCKGTELLLSLGL